MGLLLYDVIVKSLLTMAAL